jgi:hypothetical protein
VRISSLAAPSETQRLIRGWILTASLLDNVVNALYTTTGAQVSQLSPDQRTVEDVVDHAATRGSAGPRSLPGAPRLVAKGAAYLGAVSACQHQGQRRIAGIGA